MTAELPGGWPYTSQGRGVDAPLLHPIPKRIWWSDERRDTFERMWREDKDVGEIADFFEISESNVYSKANQWKLGRRRRRGGGGKPGAPRKRKRRNLRADPTGQRRKTRLAATDGPHLTLAAHDPRSVAGITVFPTTVKPAALLPRLLKSGHNSYKIGKVVAKGRWRGMPIFTLTLQERFTCPRTCKEWLTCYGNNMPFADRIHDDGTLLKRLWGEVAALSAQHPAGFVVRLHVLGDFFSVSYVRFWRGLLEQFPPLRIFGFTARLPGADVIGDSLVCLVRDHWDRCALRFSGAGYETHCSEVVDRPEEARGIICPAERDPDRSCATCGLCWASDRTITFLRH